MQSFSRPGIVLPQQAQGKASDTPMAVGCLLQVLLLLLAFSASGGFATRTANGPQYCAGQRTAALPQASSVMQQVLSVDNDQCWLQLHQMLEFCCLILLFTQSVPPLLALQRHAYTSLPCLQYQACMSFAMKNELKVGSRSIASTQQQGCCYAGLTTSTAVVYLVLCGKNIHCMSACCKHLLFCLVYRTLCEAAELEDITERWYDDVNCCVQLM